MSIVLLLILSKMSVIIYYDTIVNICSVYLTFLTYFVYTLFIYLFFFLLKFYRSLVAVIIHDILSASHFHYVVAFT